jgi:type IV secretory pathway ATPase VirB11/archaellum biosynthesis ATPase
MEVHIGDVTSTVRAVDGDSLLAPQTMEKIVRVVLQAVRDQEDHGKRVRAEQRVTGGVSQELEEEK